MGFTKKVNDGEFFIGFTGRPGLPNSGAACCALECAVRGLTPLTTLLIMTHATTMLLPSRVSDASLFAWLAYVMTKRGHG